MGILAQIVNSCCQLSLRFGKSKSEIRVGTHCVCPQLHSQMRFVRNFGHTQCVPTVNLLKLLANFRFAVGANHICPKFPQLFQGEKYFAPTAVTTPAAPACP